MPNDQPAQSHHHLLLAVVVFALLGLSVFLIIWKSPSFFEAQRDVDEPPRHELTTDEKLDVLAQLQRSLEKAGTPPAEELKMDVLERLSASNDRVVGGDVLSEQQKIDILDALNAP